MKEIKVNPKGGWKYATNKEMQKTSANMIGQYHALNPFEVYKCFNELNIYLPSVMYYFMGKKLMAGNGVLLDLLLNGNSKPLFDMIGDNYTRIFNYK